MGGMKNAIASSKRCFKCEAVKPLSDFYRHPGMADGHLGKCKQCTKDDSNKYRAENLERIREYDRRRARIPERAAAAMAVNRLWRAEDVRRMKCHNAVARAIKAGRLERQPCSVCGSAKSLAHHESYDRPLDVVWYCQPHHKERHKQMVIEGIEP
jgi:hypothetical protein